MCTCVRLGLVNATNPSCHTHPHQYFSARASCHESAGAWQLSRHHLETALHDIYAEEQADVVGLGSRTT